LIASAITDSAQPHRRQRAATEVMSFFMHVSNANADRRPKQAKSGRKTENASNFWMNGGTAEFAAKPTSSGTIKIMTRALAEHLHPSLAISRQLIWLFSPEARFG
jgi:hypothetical protein